MYNKLVSSTVPFKKYFHRAIQKHYPQKAESTIAAAEVRFEGLQPDIAFSKDSGNLVDRRMNIAAYFLACIMELDKAGESYDTIRNLMLEIAHEYVRPKNFVQAAAKKLPVKLIDSWVGNWLVKQMAKRTGAAHRDGFKIKIITDKKETFGLGYGIDILECGICKLYNKHGQHKFTSLLCEVDHITSSLAGLTLKRNGTIALGASKCDFRFEKKAS